MRAPVLSNSPGLNSDPGEGRGTAVVYTSLRRPNCRRTTVSGSPGGRADRRRSLVGLLQRDPNSYYTSTPLEPAATDRADDGQFTFADLLKYAGAA